MKVSREELARSFATALSHLIEVQRRVVTGAVSAVLGRGGKTAMAEVSGMSRNTVIKAEREVVADIEPSSRQRAVDGGGSNGHRVQMWRNELSNVPVEIGLEITVCHYPSGTSKRNENEHKMFSFISMNWRGRPLVSYRTITELISAITSAKGLTIRRGGPQPPRDPLKGSDAEFTTVPLTRHEFHGGWNWTIARSESR